MHLHHRLRRAVSIAALTAAIATPAQAQLTPQEAAEIEPDEIVVTAQRREQTLIEVPLSVQAFSGAQLENAGINDLNELVKLIPGASVVSSAAPGFETFQIRGISSGTVGDATVGYYVDGTVFGIPNLQLAPPSRLYDLERVEVLRGPQGTLYGAGAMGGLVNMVTAAPDPDKWVIRGRGDISATDGGSTNFAFDGALNVPIVDDKVALRISGGYSYLSGFAGTAAEPEARLNDTDSYNIRGKLLIAPTENLDITLSVWRIFNNQDYSNNLISIDPPTLPNAFGTQPFIQTAVNIYTAVIGWDAGPVRVESSTAYYDHTLSYDTTANLVTGLGIRAVADFHTTSFTQEVRLLSNGDGPFNWIVGGIYTDATINSDFDITVVVPTAPPLILPFQNTFDAPLTSQSFAFYGEVSYDFFDGKLTPLVGLRYYNDSRSASGFTSLGGLPPTFSDTSADFDSVNPRFNLTYRPTDTGMVYVNVASGFRSGGIQTEAQALFASLQGVDTGVIVNPDNLWTYELGTKWGLGSNNNIQLEAAFYYTNWNDIQIPFVTNAGLVAIVNGGDATIYGLDLGLTWRAAKGLTIQAAGNINSSTFSEVNPALSAALPSAQDGDQLPGVPKGNFTIAAAYTTPISSDFDLNLYGSYAFLAPQTDLASGLESASLDQITLRAGVSSGPWSAELYVNNLLNDLGPTVVTTTAVQPLYPRVFGLTVGYSY